MGTCSDVYGKESNPALQSINRAHCAEPTHLVYGDDYSEGTCTTQPWQRARAWSNPPGFRRGVPAVLTPAPRVYAAGHPDPWRRTPYLRLRLYEIEPAALGQALVLQDLNAGIINLEKVKAQHKSVTLANGL